MTLKWFASGITALGLTAMAATAPAPVPCIQQAGAPSKGDTALDFVSGETGLAIADLIAQAKVVTGEEFSFKKDDLTDARVTFCGTVTVPREKFLAFFDWCLHEAGFIDVEHDVAGARIHSIEKTSGTRGAGHNLQELMSEARVVDRAELDAMSDRFALVSTTYCCKHVAARDLMTTMSLFFPSSMETIRNIEGSECLVMTGCAAILSAVCSMMDRIDARIGESEGFQRPQVLARRVAALEIQVAALIKRAK